MERRVLERRLLGHRFVELIMATHERVDMRQFGGPTRATRPGLGRALALGVSLALAIATLAVGPAAATPQMRGKVDPALLRVAEGAPSSTLSIIVRERRPSTSVAEDAVRGLGGVVTRELSIVGGFAAELPGAAIAELAGSQAVARVWGDARIRVNTVDMSMYDALPENLVWQDGIHLLQARMYRGMQFLGAGVTVALIDTGVSPLADLGDRVLARVDFTPEHDGYDRYGHGTHMAGLIAGSGQESFFAYQGVAPGANLVSVKVAGADGSTDVSIVLAAIEWVVAHRSQYGIRVLNLSFGTDATQPYSVDPLDYAVERAWFSGISVVVAAGNRGPGAGTIDKPGDDPYVITVGAADLNNTLMNSKDDRVAPFSSRGPTQDGFAKPDVVAPGITLVSQRAEGSTVDRYHAEARVGESYFKGTGTSQAAAVVSGILALAYEANPRLTPDVAKAIIVGTAQSYLASQPGAGAGLVDAAAALAAVRKSTFRKYPANRGLTPSTGLGSLEGSRGSYHVYADLDGDGVQELVQGEVDVLGQVWDGRSWSARSWSGDSWASSPWSEYVVSSADGALATMEASGWSARSWSGTSWDGRSWSDQDWTARSWSGGLWG